MKPREISLSREQHAAILTPRNLLVRAGAGSGKTEVLARRFVALLAGDIEGSAPLMPEQIAAITFTEKAAHDMSSRIGRVLEQRISDQPAGERREHLVRARRKLPLARISTIHAFCARILREQSIDAALDPDFQVLDQYESRTLLERLCKQALVAAVRKNDAGADYLVRTYRLSRNSPFEGALEIVLRIMDELAQLGRSAQWLEEATRQSSVLLEAEPARLKSLAQELARLLGELLEAGPLSPRAEEKIAPLRIHYQEYRRRILAIEPQLEPAALDFLRELCELIPDARGKIQPLVSAIRRIVNSGTGTFSLGGELIASYGAFRAAPRAIETAAIIKTIAAKLDLAKAEQRVLTFDDLLIHARDLLRDNSLAVQHYRSGIQTLLVDEYQDTNGLQHEIIMRLSEPDADGRRVEVFIVGDEKQSIYRFRGADVTVFHRARQSLPAELPLLGNRRSTPNIVTFVNRLGAHLMRSSEPKPPAHWIEWSPHHELEALREPLLDVPVEIIIGISNSISRDTQPHPARALPLNATARRVIEARAIASRIRQLTGHETLTDPEDGSLRPIRYGDIAILLRAFTDAAIYENALLDAGIPCYTVKGRGFFDCQEIVDVVELLTAVNAPDDSMALAAVLRSPFFGISDACLAEIVLHRPVHSDGSQSWWPGSIVVAFAAPLADFDWLSEGRDDAVRAWQILSELRALRGQASIPEVIERALEATGYEAVMLGMRQGRQRLANLRKLVELARQFDSRQLFTFHDFVMHLRHLVEQEPYEPQAQILGESEDVVRLMTVHQAKGLEFPVVILADAGRTPNVENRSPVVDPDKGLILREVAGSGMDQIPNRLLDEFRERTAGEQQAESIRLLYVAVTRARDRLIISEGATLKEWAKQIREFVGAETIESFIESGDEQRELECAGAKIILLQPQFATPKAIEAAQAQLSQAEFAQLASRRLAFQPMRSSELVISPTALVDFDRCPRQFYLRHRLGLSEPKAGFEAGSASNAPAMGIVAHAILERLEFGANRPSDDEIMRTAELLGRPAGLDREQRSAIAVDLARYAALSNEAPTAREVPFFCHVGESVFLRGRIDALVERNGSIVVRDYKYAPASEGYTHQVQMEAYALAAAMANPERTLEAEIVFLQGHCVTVPITLPAPESIRMRMLSLGRKIIEAQSTGEYSKKPPNRSTCHQLRCGFVSRCW